MFFGGFAGIEGSQVFSLAGFGILLFRVKTIFA